MYGCVYTITCLITKKMYVGATTNTIHWRWQCHCGEARIGRYPNHPFYIDICKYGEDQFVVKVLRYRLTKQQLLKSEEFFIRSLNTIAPHGYNLRHKQGALVFSNKQWRERLTAEELDRYREKLSLGMKRRWAVITPEYRRVFGIKSSIRMKQWHKRKTQI